LLDYYKEKGKLVRVDGKLGIEQVSESVLGVLCSAKGR
jgi:adenylate kinase family enzyme